MQFVPKNTYVCIRFGDFKQGKRCFQCSVEKRGVSRAHSFEYVKKYIESHGYILISKEYKNTRRKLIMICNNNHKIEMTFGHFKNGHRCKECSIISASNKRRYSYEWIKNFIENEGYILLSKEYKNRSTKIEVICPIGHKHMVEFHSFKDGKRCSECSGNKRHTIDEVKKYVSNEGYTLLSNTYKNNKSKLDFMCDKGHIFKTSFNHFKNSGSRCPFCTVESRGEKNISKFLKENNIEFETQYRFLDCKKRGCLPFDFAIFNASNDLILLIEYDGEQHYRSVDVWGGDEGFKERQENDTIKNKYCEDNDIRLLRIPYWEFDNIEELLIKEIINKEDNNHMSSFCFS